MLAASSPFPRARHRHVALLILPGHTHTVASHGGLTTLSGGDADGILDGHDVDLPVAAEAGVRLAPDDLDDLVHEMVLDDGLDLDVGDVVHEVLSDAVGRVLCPATPEPLHVEHAHPRQPLDVVEGAGVG